MRKYLLLAGATMLGLSGSAYAALDCTTPPSCDELGYAYAANWCKDQAVLKCPFDQTKVFCGEPVNPTLPVTCKVGSLLYNDLKCYDVAPGDKAVIGVVFDNSKKLAVSITQKSNLQWSETNGSVPMLNYCSTGSYTSCDTDGRENTVKLVSTFGPSTDIAAGYCYFNTMGNLPNGSWFLPSASELKALHSVSGTVNGRLSAIGGEIIPNTGSYWSSNQYNEAYALCLLLSTGDITPPYKNTFSSTLFTRCVVSY